MAIDVGRVGIWLRSYERTDEELVTTARELDQLGYGAVWLGGASGDLRIVADMLAASERIVVVTGIVSIWTIPPADLAVNYERVATAYPDRFLLGIGSSHGVLVGERYKRPYSALVDYLDGLDAAGVPVDRRIVAALGPKALTLAGERSLGAHPYLVTPEYTAEAREILGSGPLLANEQKVVLDPDKGRAREIARAAVADPYLTLPNYVRNLRRAGYTEEDLAGRGSDRLIDALVPTGDETAIAQGIQAHLEAGADHVCMQVLSGDGELPVAQWRALAGLVA
jgi:probable F420-dependent oxidoreductase